MEGLPLDDYELSRRTQTLPVAPGSAALPISTGRAADAPQRATLPSGNMVRLPIAGDVQAADQQHAREDLRDDQRKEMVLNLVGVLAKDPTAGTKWLEGKQAAQQKQANAEQDQRLAAARFLMEATEKQTAAFGQLLANTETLSQRLAAATDEEKEQAVRGLLTFVKEQGLGFIAPTVPALLRSPDLSKHLGDAFQFMKDRPGAAAFVANISEFKKDPAAYMEKFRGFASGEATREILNRLPALVARLKPDANGRIPFDAVADVIAPDSPFLKSVFRGDVAAPEPVRKALDSALARHGVELPGTAASVAAKTAETTAAAQAGKDVANDPKNVAADAKRAAAVESATKKAALSPEIVKLETERAAKMTAVVESAKARFDTGKPLTAAEAGTMRAQFLAQSKEFTDTLRAYRRMEDTARDPSAAGDVAVLFGYMKMLDPTSVVRESEFATAENAAGVPDRVRNTWNRLMSGKRLGEEGSPTRADFLRNARLIVKGQLGQHEQVEAEFGRIAKDRKGDAGEVVPDLVGPLRKAIKESKDAPAARAATRADIDAAKREAKGDARRARQLLIDKGIDPTLAVKD